MHDLHNFIFSRPIVLFVIGVVETWFNSSIPNECLNVPAYSVLRCDRPTQGGGIMLLIRDDCHILSSNHVCFGPVQVLYVDIECTSLSSEVARFVCIYRPPNADMVNSLLLMDALEKQIAPANNNRLTIIMGDFNLTKIDWSRYFTTLNHTTADSKLLLFSQKCSFRQSVLEATHDNNYTDLVFISYDNYVADVKTDLPFYTSDHASINFDIIFDACDVQSHEDLSVNHVTARTGLTLIKLITLVLL